MRRRTLLAAAGAAAVPISRPARAEEGVDVALVLAVDVSRSIDEDEARLQREGYRNAVADPVVIGSQRGSALPFDSARTQALLMALVVFRLLPHGFRNADLRAHLAPLLGLTPAEMTPGRMTYDLRRLRLHGLIERIPGTVDRLTKLLAPK